MLAAEPGFDKRAPVLFVYSFCGVVLPCVMDPLIDFSNLFLCFFQSSFCGGCSFNRVALFLPQFFTGSDTMFLKVTNRPGCFQQIGEIYLSGIGFAILRFHTGLQICNQL